MAEGPLIIEATCDACGETFNPNDPEDVSRGLDGRIKYDHYFCERTQEECGGMGYCTAVYSPEPSEVTELILAGKIAFPCPEPPPITTTMDEDEYTQCCTAEVFVWPGDNTERCWCCFAEVTGP